MRAILKKKLSMHTVAIIAWYNVRIVQRSASKERHIILILCQTKLSLVNIIKDSLHLTNWLASDRAEVMIFRF